MSESDDIVHGGVERERYERVCMSDDMYVSERFGGQHVGTQINHTGAVIPFIVPPGDNLQELLIECYSSLDIKNVGPIVTNENYGIIIFSLTQGPLHFPL